MGKAAYVAKADREPEYVKLISDLDARNASKTERIQNMRAFWERRLGVPDIAKMPGYDPVGEYQLGFKDTRIVGGYRHQYRFDISDADLEKQMKGYSLYHNLSNGESGLYFKKRLLRRMDAISYSNDCYGKVKDDYVSQNRGADPKTWKSFSRNSSNETILKYSVTLLDNLESIVVHGQIEKKRVLDVFKKHGISVLPDGRKIEEIVIER